MTEPTVKLCFQSVLCSAGSIACGTGERTHVWSDSRRAEGDPLLVGNNLFLHPLDLEQLMAEDASFVARSGSSGDLAEVFR